MLSFKISELLPITTDSLSFLSDTFWRKTGFGLGVIDGAEAVLGWMMSIRTGLESASMFLLETLWVRMGYGKGVTVGRWGSMRSVEELSRKARGWATSGVLGARSGPWAVPPLLLTLSTVGWLEARRREVRGGTTF